jgi:hypothetical protein
MLNAQGAGIGIIHRAHAKKQYGGRRNPRAPPLTYASAPS